MTPPPDNGQSKRNRRDEAREKARIAREAAARKRRRNRVFIIGGSILAAVVVVAVIIFAVVSNVQPAGPGPKNMASDGLLLQGNATTGAITATKTTAIKAGGKPTPTDDKKLTKTVNITVYLDYQCPYCDQFETTNASQIKTWLSRGAVTYEVHPLAILDASSLGNKYSTRSANAAACVANYEPDKFLAVNTAFFANQPAEQTNGRTDAQIISVVKKAGATNSSIPSCITSQKFKGWVADATSRALDSKLPNSSIAKVTGTPTVIVNGKQYSGSLTSASDFQSFVTSAAAS